jgi:chromosome segregation ATPase
LVGREVAAREEFEAAKQAMQDWEVLAMEERSVRESLAERVSVLEEQLSAQTDSFERVASERDSLSLTVDGLQRALRDLQDGRLGCCGRFSFFLERWEAEKDFFFVG